MSDNPIKLDAIIGQQLSSVEFVQDYVQLHFDGPYIIAFTWPVVESYRDALCDRISRKVRTALISGGNAVTIGFDDGGTIRISLKQEDRVGPEAILYRAGSKASDRILEF